MTQGPLDRAIRALLAGEPEIALAWAGARAEAAPRDPVALLVTCRALVQADRAGFVAEALVATVDLALAAGALPVAVAACCELRRLGVDAGPQYARIARAFARGSSDLSPRAPEPPALCPPALTPWPRGEAVDRALWLVEAAIAARGPDTLPKVPAQILFSSLDETGLRALIEIFRIDYHDADAVLIAQGSLGVEAFLLVRGELDVRRARGAGEWQQLGRLGAGALFGEMALLARAPRPASVVAARPSIVLVAGEDALEQVARGQPRVGEELAAHCRGRMVHSLVHSSPLFAAIDADDRLGVMVRFVTRTYEAGEPLITQAAETDGLHLIASGEVEVLHREADEVTHLASLGVGEVVGEMGLVLRRPAAADVIAKVPTVTLHLPRDGFLDLIREHPTILSRLYEVAVRRDQETTSILAQDASAAEDCLVL